MDKNNTEATFYVATNGNDGWSGTIAEPNEKDTDGPVATLYGARRAVREYKEKNGLDKPITVLVRDGKYFLEQTFILRSADSGSRECPVTYKAYPGEKPIISGGRKLENWKPYSGRILQCEVPQAKGGKWKFRQLFCNGQRQIRARFPNFDAENPICGGWAFVEEPVDYGNYEYTRSKHEGADYNYMREEFEGGRNNAFRYKTGTLPTRLAKPSEAEVTIFPGPGWLRETIPVKSIDYSERIIVLEREPWTVNIVPWFFAEMVFRSWNRFYIENVLEALSGPGQWCLDNEEGIVYFWPGQDSIDDCEVVAPALDCLFDLAGACWVTISGLTFTETLGGDSMHHSYLSGYGAMLPRQGLRYCGDAMHMTGASHCRIEKNHFYAVGGNAIYLHSYNRRNVISRNEISCAGANGVCVLGSNVRHPESNEIIDNEIHHCGRLHTYVAGVFMGVCNHTIVAHNYIHHMPHHGINLGSNGIGRNIIEYNEIRHVCEQAHDATAINSWGDVPQNDIKKDAERCGHIIRYNLIRDIISYCVDETKGQMVPFTGSISGIYLDDCTSNCLVYGNIIIRTGYGVYLHNGKNNLIENNIIINCTNAFGYADGVSGRAGNSHLIGFARGLHICRNIVYSSGKETILHFLHWFNSHKWDDLLIGRSDNNIFYCKSGQYRIEDKADVLGDIACKGYISFEDWQKKAGHDENSVIAEPLFVDAEKDDFNLKPDSPALALGFQPIDIKRIGIREK